VANLVITGSAPSTLIGSAGDTAGMVRVDSNYIYYCTSTFVPSSYSVVWGGVTGNAIFFSKGSYPTPQPGWTITNPGNTKTFTLSVVNDYSADTWMCTFTGTPYGEGGGGTATLTNPSPATIWVKTPLSATTYSNSNVASYLVSNPQAGTYSNSNVASYLVSNPQAGTYSNTNVSSYLSGTVTVGNINFGGGSLRINGTTQTIDTSNGSSITVGSRLNLTGTAGGLGLVVSYPASFSNNVTVSGTGAISTPNRPAFRVNGTGLTYQTSANVNLKGTAITSVYNQGSWFNATTGIFTAPVTGLYQTTLNVRVGNNNSTNQVAVLKNGNYNTGNVVLFWETDTNTGTATHFGSAGMVQLNAGEWLSANVITGACTFDNNDHWDVTFIG
jgi:hypothetical protein